MSTALTGLPTVSAPPLPRVRSVKWRLLAALALAYPFHHDVASVNVSAGDVIVGLIGLLLFYKFTWGCIELPRYVPKVLIFLLWIFMSMMVNTFAPANYFSPLKTGVETLKIIAAASWMLAVFWLLREDFANRTFRFLTLSVVFAAAFAFKTVVENVVMRVPRPSGPFENPNIYGNYLVMIVFFALGARAMLDQQMVHPWSMVTRLIARYRTGALMGVAPVILFGLLSTGSRGAMLGLGVGALAYVPWTRLRVRPRRALLVGLAALLVLPAGVWYFQQHPFVMVRITRTLEGDGPNIDGRFILWRAARDAFLGNPFFGVGYGEFGPYAERTHDLPPMVTHETYLSQACELGIFGLLLFIVLFGSVLLDSWHLTRRGSGLARACFAYLVATAVQGLTNNVDQFRAVWIVFGILAAFMVNREEALPPAARGPS